MVWFTSSTVRSSVCLRLAMAALLTRQSSPPNASHASSATASARSRSPRSALHIARLGSMRHDTRSRTFSRRSARRATMPTVAPRSASCGASAGADPRRRAGDENGRAFDLHRGSPPLAFSTALWRAASRSSVVTPVVASAWCTSVALRTARDPPPQSSSSDAPAPASAAADAIERVGWRHVHVARHHRRDDRPVAVDRDAGTAQLAALVVPEPDPSSGSSCSARKRSEDTRRTESSVAIRLLDLLQRRLLDVRERTGHRDRSPCPAPRPRGRRGTAS